MTDSVPVILPVEVSEVITIPFTEVSVDDLLKRMHNSLLDLEEELRTTFRRRVRMVGEKCRSAADLCSRLNYELDARLSGKT